MSGLSIYISPGFDMFCLSQPGAKYVVTYELRILMMSIVFFAGFIVVVHLDAKDYRAASARDGVCHYQWYVVDHDALYHEE